MKLPLKNFILIKFPGQLYIPSKYFLMSAFSMLILFMYKTLVLSHSNIWVVGYEGVKGILNPLTYNDSEWYINISQYGYTDNKGFAFFPLYPLLIKAMYFLGIPSAWGGVLVSWFCFYVAGVLLYKMLPEEQKIIGMQVFFFSPISIFCYSVYTESLFLFLTILMWYLYKKEKYLLTGLTAGLAMLTRNSAYIMVLCMAIDYIARNIKFRTFDKKFLLSLLKCGLPAISIGMLYPLYTLKEKGDLMFFMTVQTEYWHKGSMFPLKAVLGDILFLFLNPPNVYTVTIIINFITIFLIPYLSFKCRRNHWIFGLMLTTILLSILSVSSIKSDTPFMVSMFRYLWGLFPLYFLITEWLTQYKHRQRILTAGLFINCIVTVLIFFKSLVA